MKKIIYICDLCRKNFEVKETSVSRTCISFSADNVVEIENQETVAKFYTTKESFDLCAKCLVELYDFFHPDNPLSKSKSTQISIEEIPI